MGIIPPCWVRLTRPSRWPFGLRSPPPCFVKEPLDARVAEALFSQLDGGGKGYITAGDVQRVAAFFNLSIPRHVLHDMVQLFAGPSGKLAKADFQKLVQ